MVWKTSISSRCNDILNLNFTYLRSKVIKKLPSASVNTENQNKKSSETPDNLEFSVSNSDFLQEIKRIEKWKIPFYFYYPIHK